jgi:hypothetical protein
LRGSLVSNTAKKHVGALVSLIALEAIGAGVSVLTPLPLQAAIDSISGKSKALSFLPASWTHSLLTLAIASVGYRKAGAAARVSSMDGALDQVLAWLRQPTELAIARQKGLDLVAQSRGAAKRYAQAIAGLL